MAARPELEEHVGSIKREALIAFRMMPSSARGSIALDDLIQEGFFVFLRASDRFEQDHNSSASFNTMLVTYLKKRYTNLVRDSYTQKRFAPVGPLPEENAEEDFSAMPSRLVYHSTPEQEVSAVQIASLVRGSLTDASRSVFDVLLNPPEGLINIARATMLRKQRQKREGRRVRGFDSVRITKRHVAVFLGLSRSDVNRSLGEITDRFRELGVAV